MICGRIHERTVQWNGITARFASLPNVNGFRLIRSYRFLSSKAHWSKGSPRQTVERSLDNSLCFSLFCGVGQIGFARVISGRASIACLGDRARRIPRERVVQMALKVCHEPFGTAAAAPLDIVHRRCARAPRSPVLHCCPSRIAGCCVTIRPFTCLKTKPGRASFRRWKLQICPDPRG